MTVTQPNVDAVSQIDMYGNRDEISKVMPNTTKTAKRIKKGAEVINENTSGSSSILHLMKKSEGNKTTPVTAMRVNEMSNVGYP